MENKTEFKPFDKVLVRDGNTYEWQPELFYKINEEGKYCTLGNVEWSQCIPYQDNEHLMDTAIAGVIIPTEKKELAVSYFNSGWDYLKNININSITVIRGSIVKYFFTGGKVLWQKNNK